MRCVKEKMRCVPFFFYLPYLCMALNVQGMKITKNRYLAAFAAVVAALAVVRCANPKVALHGKQKPATTDSLATLQPADSLPSPSPEKGAVAGTHFFDAAGNIMKNRIFSVPNFGDAFPDSNNVQLEAAMRYGVKPVLNRDDAERRKKELVYIGASPYYTVDKLKSSIPYLVPRAAVLLGDMGRIFFDSLQMKGVPLHRIIVTSVLRTQEDVDKLRSRNGNATANSCHLYGTTFDVCYNRYTTVSDPDGKPRRAVRNDTLKWVLSEVLRDMRQNNRCYIKYEVKQGCFHITVR